MTRRMLFVAACSLFAATLPQQASANCQIYAGGTWGVSQASPIYTDDMATGGMLGVICGKSVRITGSGGCEVIQRNTATGSAGATCLTLGRGVKFSGNSYYGFTCSGNSDCGTAISVTESGSGTTIVNDARVTGRWTNGIVNGYPTATSQANDTEIDLSAAASPVSGIDGFRTVDHAYVTGVHGGGAGVILRGSATIQHASIYDNDNGVRFIQDNTIENTRLADNGVHLLTENGTYYGEITMKGVDVENFTSCDCSRTSGGCTFDIDYCTNYTGTDVSFIRGQIWE